MHQETRAIRAGLSLGSFRVIPHNVTDCGYTVETLWKRFRIMEQEKWKTVAYKFGKNWRCGNCGGLVEDLCWNKQLDECLYCHWLVVYPQSTAPTTTQ